MLFFAVVMVACTGTDTETIVKQTQCHDDTIVTGDETCPEPVVTPSQGSPRPPSQETTPNADDEDTNRGDSRCTTQVKGPQTHEGSSGDDNICGDDAANTIEGRDGRDTIRGGKGNDKLYGDFIDPATGSIGDDDKLYGEEGDDELYGGIGRDILDGGPGDDEIYSGSGDDEFIGGVGKSDTVFYLATTFAEGVTGVTVDLAQGFAQDEYGDQDELKEIENVTTGIGTDEIIGNASANTLKGGAGADTITGGSGDDTIDGGGNLAEDTKLDGEAGNDTLIVGETATLNEGNASNFEHLQARAGDGDMNLTGDNKKNTLTGNEGVNVLTGLDDVDTLIGGAGNDILRGGKGTDFLTGGEGNDCFELTVDDSSESITDFETGDIIRVTGTLPDPTMEDGGAISSVTVGLAIRGRKVVALETWEFDSDLEDASNELLDREKILDTYTTTIRDLPEEPTTDVLATGVCISL